MMAQESVEWRSVTMSKLLVSLETGSRPRGGATSAGVVSIGGEHLDGSGGFRFDRLRYIPADFAESLRRGRIRQGDVLVVKDGATTGKVALVRPSFPFPEAFANEHVFVCRPGESLDPLFLYYFLVSAEGQRQILLDFRGAAQGGISRGFVDRVCVPCPPLEVQGRVAEGIERTLSRIEAGRADLARALAATAVLRRSVAAAAVEGTLLSMAEDLARQQESASEFIQRIKLGSPARPRRSRLGAWEPPDRVLPTGWTWARLRDLGELDRGKSRHRPRNDPRLYGGPYPFVQTGDIRRSRGSVRKHSQTYNELGLAQSRLWPAGTLCITIAANIADTAILTYPACFPDSVVGFLADGDESVTTTRFVQLCLQAMQQRLWELAPATAQKNINLATLESIAVPLPPPREQDRIVAEADRIIEFAEVAEGEARRALGRSVRLRASVLESAMNRRSRDSAA